MKLSDKAAAIKPSATLEISAKANRMKAEGVDMVSFSAGQPDFPTPDNICQAAIDAMKAGHTKYTATNGIVELRDAIVDKFKVDYGYTISNNQIVVNCGAKHSLNLALSAVVNPGDEVIIPAPYWVSYPHMVRLADATPVIVETTLENRFRLTAEQLRAAITDKSRVLILNSPSNPTGEVYTKEELAALAEVVVEKDLVVISDDIYEKLIYDGLSFISMSQISEEVRAHCIVVNGLSKCAAMTGWRVGYIVAPVEVAQAIQRLQGQMTSHPTSIAQYASVEAIAGDTSYTEKWNVEFTKRRDRMVEMLNAIDGVTCPKPQGAFYVFADWRELMNKRDGDRLLDTDMAWADYLIEKAHVASVPGTPFGAPGFLRLSFATSLDRIEEGVRRIANAVSSLA